MKKLSILLACLAATSGLALAQAPDSDGDGVADAEDNCTQVANTGQQDTDGDDYGNMCDGDLNNDGNVNEADLEIMKGVLNKEASTSAIAAAADLDNDGMVTAKDFARLRAQTATGPGPSGTKP